MRRASLTSSLIAPVTGSESPALSVRSATICMSLSAQVNEIMSHSLSASEAPELQRGAQLGEIDAGRFRQPAGFDQAHGIDPQQEVVHGLADLAVADLAKLGVV